jgi:hypothetical protein
MHRAHFSQLPAKNPEVWKDSDIIASIDDYIASDICIDIYNWNDVAHGCVRHYPQLEYILRSAKTIAGVFTVISLSGCGNIIPSLPTERELPVKAIVTEAVCETADALQAINMVNNNDLFEYRAPSYLNDDEKSERLAHLDQYRKGTFQPDQWAITFKLEPRNTAQYDAGIAGTFKSNASAKKKLFQFGENLAGADGIPAANFDATAYTDGTVQYTVHSSTLVELGNSKIKEICGNVSVHKDFIEAHIALLDHNVSNNLHILDWITRFLSPVDGKIISIASSTAGSNSFSYTTDLKDYYGLDTSASYTFSSLKWAGGPSLGFEQMREETLTINFANDPKTKKGGVSSGATSKLQQMDLINSIRGLPQ